MTERTVLVSGAGIAGATLAFWLTRNGFRVTVVERAGVLRSSGSPVDVRGPAAAVAERMGVMPEIRAAATRVAYVTFIDERGRRTGRINLGAIQRATGAPDVELARGDLSRILLAAGRQDAELLLDDTVTAISQDDQGVDVIFERAAARRFDLVIGADGLHSAVRRLVFGPESDLVRHAGMYVGGMPLDGPAEDPRDVLIFNRPGQAVALHPGTGQALVAFMFRSPVVPSFDHRDTGQHQRLLAEAFAGAGWRVPELLEQVRTAGELYFDSVSMVDLPSWSHGRVALVGDAASCVSLFGDGSTLAIAGGATLAEELGAEADHRLAFRRFEERHRVLVDPKMRNVEVASRLLVPATGAGIAVRNLATRLWPAMAAGAWLARVPREVVTRHRWRAAAAG